MGFTKRVTTRNQRHRLLVVHRHAPERFADIPRRCERVRVAIGPFGIHVDEAHLHGAERIVEFAVTLVALVSEPRLFWSPVRGVRFPDVHPTTGEAKGRKPH